MKANNNNNEQGTKAMKANNDTQTKILLVDGDCKCELRGDRYVFSNDLDNNAHSISADPSITSEERLLGHWRGFLEVTRRSRLNVETSKASEISTCVRRAKDELRKDEDIDYVDKEIQILAIDKNGERIEDATTYSYGCPTLRELRALFLEFPQAIKLDLSGKGRAFLDRSLPLAERYENADIVDYWGIDVYRR